MIGDAVKALAIVFPDELPVGPDHVVLDRRDFGAPELLRPDRGGQVGPDPVERGRGGAQRDEDKALELGRRDRMQPERRPVQVLLHARRVHEGSVEPVGPGVVRADQPLGGAARGFRADDRAAVAADVVKRTDRAVLPPDHDDRVRAHLQGEPVARRRDLARMAGEQPARPPDRVQVGAVDSLVAVELAQQGVVRGLPGQQAGQAGGAREAVRPVHEWTDYPCRSGPVQPPGRRARYARGPRPYRRRNWFEK